MSSMQSAKKAVEMSFTISYLWSHPKIHGGAQMVRGSRVALEAIHQSIKEGDTIEEVCESMDLHELHTKKAYKEWLENLKEKTP